MYYRSTARDAVRVKLRPHVTSNIFPIILTRFGSTPILPFPSDILAFSFCVGVRKLMNQFVTKRTEPTS